MRPEYRGKIGRSVEFEFREKGELQDALTNGTAECTMWTATFVVDTFDGAQLYYYYPQLCLVGEKDKGVPFSAEFNALAFEDAVDGEIIVCYRAFFPAPKES